MTQISPLPPVAPPPPTDALRKAAADLETEFLVEMLKSAGLHKSRESYGGGAGESQFQSLLVRAQAAEMVRSGGIGLSEALFHSLKGRLDDGAL